MEEQFVFHKHPRGEKLQNTYSACATISTRGQKGKVMLLSSEFHSQGEGIAMSSMSLILEMAVLTRDYT